MNARIKAALFSAILILPCFIAGTGTGRGLFAFEWPAKNLDADSFRPSFSQNRKGRYNASLLFTAAERAAATDSGKIIVVITEHQQDGNWFESTLGNALVLSHSDSLISVYGNLSEESAAALLEKNALDSGDEVGGAENSAWNEARGTLEFQIADTNEKTFINPMILMPRTQKPERILLDGIVLENQFGRSYNMRDLRSLPAGSYTLYKRHDARVIPFTSSVLVNGTELERISHSTLKSQDGALVLSGKDNYKSADFFPSKDLELLGHILLPHGSNIISVIAAGILENESTVNYSISCY